MEQLKKRLNQLLNEAIELDRHLLAALPKSILQEAIQGKLLPQNPNDEPASILLERIREEKQRLLKEGKLKKKDITDSASSKVTITSTTRKSAMRPSASTRRFRSIFRILGLGLDLQVLFASILKIKHQIIQLQHSFQWNK